MAKKKLSFKLTILQKNGCKLLRCFVGSGGVLLAVSGVKVKLVGLTLVKPKLPGSRVHSVVREAIFKPICTPLRGCPRPPRVQDSISSSQFTVHLKTRPDTSQPFFQPCRKI